MTVCVKGQERCPMSVHGFTEVGHNTSMQCYGGPGVIFTVSPTGYFDLSVGGYFPLYKEKIVKEALTCNPSAIINGVVAFPLKYNHVFSLENRYLFRSLGAYGVYELNAGLLASYKSARYLVAVGMSSRLIAAHKYDPADGNRFVSEPFNLLYRIEGYLFRRDARSWNVGLRFSNFSLFRVSHSSDPHYSLLGEYMILDCLQLVADVDIHPAGVFNLNAHYYESYCNIGVKYKW